MDSYFRPAIEAMDGYVPGEQPRDAGIIKLNTNENPYPPAPGVAAALRGLDESRLNRYPDPVANPVRDVIASVFGFDRDWVLAGNGSDDILTIVTRAFAGEGGAIATPAPSYSLYPVLAEIQGARTIEIPLGDGFVLPEDTAAQAAGASVLFLARPNAPTGNAAPLATMRRICREFTGVVLIDEAYVDFAADDCLALTREFPNVIVSRTLSKGYSLAGVRFGFAIARPELIAGMMKVKDSYNVNMLTQLAAAAAISDQAYLKATAAKVVATREQVAAALAGLGFTVCPSQANFLFVKPPLPAPEYFAALRERKLVVRYFKGPRTGDYVRVTIGTEAEMAAFLTATEAIVRR